MKRIFILTALVLLAISCKKETTKLEFTSEQMTAENLPDCKEDICPEIDIQLVKAQGDDQFAKTVNDAVGAVVAASLTISPDEEAKVNSLDEGVSNFINDFRDYKAEFAESPAGYEIKVVSKVSYQDANLLSIALDTYTYWGGAHGYGSKSYLNFDVQTGEQLDNEALIKEEGDFKTFVEKKFREQQNIPADGSINDTGYMFENESFSLAESMGFEDDDMVLVYNPYEVASYAEGQITVRVHIEDVKQFLAVGM